MKFFRILTLSLIVTITTSCSVMGPTNQLLTPSILRTSPNSFDGKQVTVTGWITLETEDANLWTSKADMSSGNTQNCVSFESPDKIWNQRKEINRRQVEVTGIFRKDVVGNSGAIRFAACSDAAIQPLLVKKLGN